MNISLAEWMTDESLDYLADMLALCDSKETLWYLRDVAPPEALKKASQLLPPRIKTQIREWVLELNSSDCFHDTAA